MPLFGKKLKSSHPYDAGVSETLRRWVQDVPGAERIGSCRFRHRARVAGVAQCIRVVPQAETSHLEVELYDGSDILVGVWFGRTSIPGIDLGTALVLEGTVAPCPGKPRLARIINPTYELLASPIR